MARELTRPSSTSCSARTRSTRSTSTSASRSSAYLGRRPSRTPRSRELRETAAMLAHSGRRPRRALGPHRGRHSTTSHRAWCCPTAAITAIAPPGRRRAAKVATGSRRRVAVAAAVTRGGRDDPDVRDQEDRLDRACSERRHDGMRRAAKAAAADRVRTVAAHRIGRHASATVVTRCRRAGVRHGAGCRAARRGATYQLWAMIGDAAHPTSSPPACSARTSESRRSARRAGAIGFVVTEEDGPGCRRPTAPTAGAGGRASVGRCAACRDDRAGGASASTSTSRSARPLRLLRLRDVDRSRPPRRRRTSTRVVDRPAPARRGGAPGGDVRLLRWRHAVACSPAGTSCDPRRDPAVPTTPRSRSSAIRTRSTPTSSRPYRAAGVTALSFGVQSMRPTCSRRSAVRTTRPTSRGPSRGA